MEARGLLALPLVCLLGACLSPPTSGSDSDGGANETDAAPGCFKGPTLPESVSGAAAAEINNDIYLIGGYIDSGVTNHVWRLGAGAGTWERMKDLPAPVALANVAEVGGAIYVLGGINDGGAVKQAWYYTSDAGWTALDPTGPTGGWRGAAAVAVEGGQIVLVGGAQDLSSTPTGSTAVDAFVVSSKSWIQLGSYPLAVSRASAQVVNGTVYVFGGFESGAPSPAVYSMAQGAADWTPGRSMADGLDGMVSVASGDQVLVAGGQTADSDAIDDERVYDTQSDSWSDPGKRLCQPRSLAAGALVDGTLHVLGGTVGEVNEPEGGHFLVPP